MRKNYVLFMFLNAGLFQSLLNGVKSPISHWSLHARGDAIVRRNFVDRLIVSDFDKALDRPLAAIAPDAIARNYEAFTKLTDDIEVVAHEILMRGLPDGSRCQATSGRVLEPIHPALPSAHPA